ncbi:SLC13 family permease [Mailhella sp.]|uniref:SLC13 family permease n=1 Tax=Mailhella sp. TaxID=1981029 RepID=UPI003AB74AC9
MQKKLVCFIGIILLSLVLYLMPTPEGLTPKGHASIIFMLAAVLFWVTEALPIAFAAILFTVLPAICHIAPLPKMMANFATPTIFFVFAMFIVSIAFQNSGFSRRIVLWASVKSKGNPEKLLLYLMLAGGLLSTILADIPVMAMLVPVALVILQNNKCEPGISSFGRAMMIGLPFACLIGGVGTPAGSSMNAMTIGLLKDTAHVNISFLEWTCVGMPIVLILIPVAWFFTIKVYPPEMDSLVGMEMVEQEYEELGKLSSKEWKFIIILLINMTVWMTDKFHQIPLPVACVLGATLFLLPGVNLVEWSRDGHKIGWEVLMVVGSANSLGVLLWDQGAASWIASNCLGGIAGMPLWMMIAIISAFTVVVHLIIPVNTAIVAVMLPALVALASTMGTNAALLAIPMGFSVSAALLLPLDPVSLVSYNSGYYKMGDMFKPGIFVSIVWVIVVPIVMLVIARPLGLM